MTWNIMTFRSIRSRSGRPRSRSRGSGPRGRSRCRSRGGGARCCRGRCAGRRISTCTLRYLFAIWRAERRGYPARCARAALLNARGARGCGTERRAGRGGGVDAGGGSGGPEGGATGLLDLTGFPRSGRAWDGGGVGGHEPSVTLDLPENARPASAVTEPISRLLPVPRWHPGSSAPRHECPAPQP
jgi:hypothetical protein